MGIATGASYTAKQMIPLTQAVVANNHVSNGNYGAPGLCGAVSTIVHGWWTGVIFDGNVFDEPTAAARCIAIGVTNGNYGPAENTEQFHDVSLRHNTILNFGQAFRLNNCQHCTIEDNYVYTKAAGANGGYFEENYAHTATDAIETAVTYANNTIYIANPTATSWGILVSREGSNYNITGNLIYFGAGSTTSTACFITDSKASGTTHSDSANWLPSAAFDNWDYNLCHFAGAPGAWSWNGGSAMSLAAQRMWDSRGFDTHSVATDPLLVAPGTSPAFDATSPARNAGHPVRTPRLGIGHVLRSSGDPAPSIGAWQYGATARVPSFATSIEAR
jgi:hypothetical protein